MQKFFSLLSWRLFTAQHVLGGKTPETCWAVNKRQDNKLENCCIWLMIYFNCTMMHGLTNRKSFNCFNLPNDYFNSLFFQKLIQCKPVTTWMYLCVVRRYVWNAVATFQTMSALTDFDLWIAIMRIPSDVHPNMRCEKIRSKFISTSFSQYMPTFVLFVILYRPT